MASTGNNYLSVMPFRDIVNYDIQEMFTSSKDRIQQLMNDRGLMEYIKRNNLSKIIDPERLSLCDYYDEQQFNRLKNIGDAHLNVFSLNIRSLPLHGVELKIFLSILRAKFHILIITEIGSKGISTVENLFPDYWFEHVLPNNSTKGGVGIYISKEILKPKIQKDDSMIDSHIEFMQVKSLKTSAENIHNSKLDELIENIVLNNKLSI